MTAGGNTSQAELARLRRHEAWIATAKWPLIVVAVGIALLASYPVVSSIAGKNTSLSLSLSLTIGVTVAGLAGTLTYRQKFLAEKTRRETLEKQLKALKGRQVKQSGKPASSKNRGGRP